METRRTPNIKRDLEERYKVLETTLIRKILVTGDREWDDIPCVVKELKIYRPGTILVHGACRGADTVCAAVAEALGFIVRSYLADWKTYPRAAGPIRNQQMLTEEHRPDEPINVCIAFHDHLDDSKGTADMVSRACKAKIPVKLVTSYVTGPRP